MPVRDLTVGMSIALVLLAGDLRGQRASTGPFPADGGVPGSHWNRVVNVAAAKKIIFGQGTPGRSPDDGVKVGQNPLPDYWFHDMEHAPWDTETFRTFLQFNLDPGVILKRGRGVTPVMPRISANGREMNQWMAKQVLDQGALGIFAPHIENAAQALNVVQSTRYPQKVGARDGEPPGQRGTGNGNALRYLGATAEEYLARADVWPLDSDGEIFNTLIIENGEGVKNIREIVRVPGVSSVMAGTSDLSTYFVGDQAQVEKAVQAIVDACREVAMICAIPAGPNDVERRIKQGFTMLQGNDEMIRKGHAVTGR